MGIHDISLEDRFDLEKDRVLLNGIQALVRLTLMQAARDRAAGLNTAGYVTGYRGSPLGGVDLQMMRAKKHLEAANVLFEPGLNEDLAATAMWGTQQAELRGEGKYDGVFGLWYGKGPGVDRSGDVMRHANMAGTSKHGGVLMAMGDDHTGESSTTLHQSDWAMVDAYMPVVSPAGVQEILDLGIYGWALSRFAGVWVGLKTMKDTVEATAVVDGRPDRMSFVTPEFEMPPGGLNIRIMDLPVEQEKRMIDYKRFAAEAFARANRIDRRVWGKPGARIGLVAAGKNWLDLMHALSLLGIDETRAERLGITTYKVAQTFPLDMTGFHEWAEGLDLIVIVEEKRKLIEVQAKEAIFEDRRGRRIYGWHKGDTWENGRRVELFPTRYALDPILIAEKLGEIFVEEGRNADYITAGLDKLREARKADNAPEIARRLAYYCSGCPHNTSTKVPEGSRAYAGIGCHYMVQWMDRNTLGFTQMGGEGANWIGESHFSTRDHVFQNMGDGTYNHSGVQAIRAALASGTNITFKILFNDAVAMTGGQHNEGDLNPYRIADEIRAMGVQHIAVVYDPKEDLDLSKFPREVEKFPREEMMQVQRRYRQHKGVSAIIYVQTCAAEKRRRRKRGLFPDPDRRVVINADICEGCGDCGVQSNCVSIVPRETEFGRKRAIDQSSCNKDYTCLEGFCPAFVTVSGGKLRKAATEKLDLPHLPEPELPAIDGTYNFVITGVGGTGVVTIGAIMAQAAHIDGKGAGMMEMAGLAQKGGAVNIHLRIANRPDDITAVRVAIGEADTIIGGDLVVSAGSATLGLMKTGRTRAVVNDHEIITGEFTRNPKFAIPNDRLRLALQARLGEDGVRFLDVTVLARKLLGDSIYSNMMILGAAWQQGLVPLTREAILRAIELNGAGVEGNKQAFDIGRWAMLHPDKAAEIAGDRQADQPKTLDERIDLRVRHLRAYQGRLLARKYLALVNRAGDLREEVALGYHKLLTYKDEYEVARLHLETTRKFVDDEFEGDVRLGFHMAPPLLSRPGPEGRPRKREFGPWMLSAMRVLARLRALRGTPLDPFGRTAERRKERQLIRQYERDIEEILAGLTPDNLKTARELAALPLEIKGFGPVKMDAIAAFEKKRDRLLKKFRAGGAPQKAAAE